MTLGVVLLMTVNPGFAGQKMIPATLDKIAAARRLLDDSGREDAEIEADGNVSLENARKMRQAGANIFVAGTAGLFRQDRTLAQGIEALREATG